MAIVLAELAGDAGAADPRPVTLIVALAEGIAALPVV